MDGWRGSQWFGVEASSIGGTLAASNAFLSDLGVKASVSFEPIDSDDSMSVGRVDRSARHALGPLAVRGHFSAVASGSSCSSGGRRARRMERGTPAPVWRRAAKWGRGDAGRGGGRRASLRVGRRELDGHVSLRYKGSRIKMPRRPRQLSLQMPDRRRWGGHRVGAGRKASAKPGLAHASRRHFGHRSAGTRDPAPAVRTFPSLRDVGSCGRSSGRSRAGVSGGIFGWRTTRCRGTTRTSSWRHAIAMRSAGA
jgi:hypothetical protein